VERPDNSFAGSVRTSVAKNDAPDFEMPTGAGIDTADSSLSRQPARDAAMASLVVLATTWAAAQWTAWRLGFQPQLGVPWFHLWPGMPRLRQATNSVRIDLNSGNLT
jgi:hypothetical protein